MTDIMRGVFTSNTEMIHSSSYNVLCYMVVVIHISAIYLSVENLPFIIHFVNPLACYYMEQQRREWQTFIDFAGMNFLICAYKRRHRCYLASHADI